MEQTNSNIKQDYVTYVISLNYPQTLLKQLSEEHNLDPILFTGIRGTTCPEELIQKHFSPFYQKFGPKGAIGCALSHLYVWKTFLKTDKQYAIIFEDDIILDHLNTKLGDIVPHYLQYTPKDFDILYLGCFESNFFKYAMSLFNMNGTDLDVNDLIKKPNVALANHAYILSRQGANKLLTHLDGKIYNHIDFCMQSLYSKGFINKYVTKPRLVYQSSTDNKPSSNVTTTYPILLNTILSNIYVDDHVRLNYITTLSIAQIGPLHITVSIILISIIMSLCVTTKCDWKLVLIFLFLISLSDLYKSRKR
jgi:GR25 family glycosyltransferase involved in LPS biosynthesis